MHRVTLAIAAATALVISGPAYAQKGNHGSSATHGNTAATTTHGNSGASTHGQSGSQTAKTTTSSNTHASNVTHGKSGDTHGNSSKTASAANTTTTKNTKKSSNTTASNPTLTPVQQKLQKNTNLADKLRMQLPQGTNLLKAAEGFKNLGQFVAAVNVSANHPDVKFSELKTRMVDQRMSLGQALQDTKKLSSSNVQAEVQRAQTEADNMIKSTSTNTTSTTSNATTATTKKKAAKTGTTSTQNK